jgi:hypothetical protein
MTYGSGKPPVSPPKNHLEMVETFACPVRLIHAARWGIRNGILVGGHGPNHDWCGISSLSDATSRPNLVHPSQSLPSRAMSNLLFYLWKYLKVKYSVSSARTKDLWNPLGPDAAVSSNFQLRGSGSWELSPQQLEPSYQQVSRGLPENRIPSNSVDCHHFPIKITILGISMYTPFSDKSMAWQMMITSVPWSPHPMSIFFR